MPRLPNEAAHAHHNRIAFDIAQLTILEFPRNDERLVLLETIVSATIKLMCKGKVKDEKRQKEIQQKIFQALIPGIKERLNED